MQRKIINKHSEMLIVSKDVIHGYLNTHKDPATLLIYEIMFTTRRNAKRIKHVQFDCCYAVGSKAPKVVMVGPRSMSLVPATQAETTTRDGEAKAGSSQGEATFSEPFKWETDVYGEKSRRAATIDGFIRSDAMGEITVASWRLTMNESAEIDLPTSFRAAVLLKRPNNEKFQCMFRITGATSGAMDRRSPGKFGEQFRQILHDDKIIYDPSLPSTSKLDIDSENLGSIDLQELCAYRLDPSSKSPGKDLMLATEETKPEQTLIMASELSTPETTNDWKTVISHFQEPTTGADEGSHITIHAAKDVPPHVWVVNQHAEEITVVISKYPPRNQRSAALSEPSSDDENVKLSNTFFRGLATKKTLPSHARDSERSSAVFPFWPREDGFGVISIFTGPDKILYLENDVVSAGEWIYLKPESGTCILEFAEAASSKSLPLFPITINGNTLDPEAEPTTTSSAQSNYILVQSWMPLTFSQGKELESMGLSLQRYVSNNTYLYRRRSTDLDKIRRLHYVIYVDIYRQGYKISASLGKSARTPQERTSRVPHEVVIVFHDDVKPETLRDCIAKIVHLNPKALNFGRHEVRHTIQKQHLVGLASIDEVWAIQKVHKRESRGVVARAITRADAGAGGNPGPYEGEGEVIAVVDTGFDTRHIRDTHLAFLDQGTTFSRSSGLEYRVGRPQSLSKHIDCSLPHSALPVHGGPLDHPVMTLAKPHRDRGKIV